MVYDSPVTDTVRRFTYAGTLAQVTALAAALRDQGMEKGDRVVIYMPKVPEAIFAILA